MARTSFDDRQSLLVKPAVLAGGVLLGGVLVGCGGRTLSDEEQLPSKEQESNAAPATSPSSVAPSNPVAPSISGAITIPILSDSDTTGGFEAPPFLPREPVPPGLPIEWSDGGGLPSVYMAKSPLGTTLEIVEVSERICVRGQLAPVPDGDYPNYWGGEVGLDFVEDAEQQAALGDGLVASGFSFRLTGAVPALLRLRVGAAGEIPVSSQYCTHVPVDTEIQTAVFLDELAYECWNGSSQPFPAAAGATLLSWQIPANEVTTQAFDFCIEQIEKLP